MFFCLFDEMLRFRAVIDGIDRVRAFYSELFIEVWMEIDNVLSKNG